MESGTAGMIGGADSVAERFFSEIEERLTDMGLVKEEGFGEYLSLDDSVAGYHKGMTGVAFWSTPPEIEDDHRSRHYMDVARNMTRREGETDWCCYVTVELPEVLMDSPAFMDTVIGMVHALIEIGDAQ